MHFPRYNVPMIILSFVLTLGLLLGSRWFYQEYGVVAPLKKSLTDTQLVKDADIITKENRTVIQLDFGEVESLQTSVHEIQRLLSNSEDYSLTVKDNRNSHLIQLWDENRFALEEAAVLGNLTEMQSVVKNNLDNAELDYWRLEVDGDNLYLQLHAGNNYLYEIVPRHHLILTEGESSFVTTPGR